MEVLRNSDVQNSGRREPDNKHRPVPGFHRFLLLPIVSQPVIRRAGHFSTEERRPDSGRLRIDFLFVPVRRTPTRSVSRRMALVVAACRP